MKRAIFLLVLCILSATSAFSQSVGINSDGTAPDGSAMLDVKSTTKGLLPPRMSLAERNLIASPATGLVIYQTDNTPGLYINNGTPAVPNWQKLVAFDEKGMSKSASQYVYVQLADGNTDIQNGTALLAAYVSAKTKSPSATNRVVVVIPPGRYNLQSTPLLLDTPYLDIVGMTSDSSAQFIYGLPAALGHGVIEQTADNVKIQNLSVYCSWEGEVHYNGSAVCAYFPESDLRGTEIYNCSFAANDEQSYGMRLSITYSGKYTNCKSGFFSFGSYYGTASGTFTNCLGSDYAFGGYYSTLSGTFSNCTAGYLSFGGYYGTASGTFTNCSGAYSAFGGFYGTASGTFINCTGANNSFGGNAGDCSTGKFYYCRGGSGAWGTNTPAVHLNCIRNDVAF